MISWIKRKNLKTIPEFFCVRESGRENKSGDIWFFPRYCMLAPPPKLESSDQNRAIKPSPPSTLELTMKNILNNIGAWGNMIWSGNFCFFRQIWRLSKKSNSPKEKHKKSFLMLSTQSWLLNLIGVWQATLSLFKFNFFFMWKQTCFLQIFKQYEISNKQLSSFQTIVKLSNYIKYSKMISSSYEKPFQIFKLFQIFKFS